MMTDKKLLFSEAQEITTTAASTYKVDTEDGGTEYSKLWVVVLCKEKFAGATGLTVTLRQADANTMASAEELMTKDFPISAEVGDAIGFRLPLFNKRYLDINYTVTGTGTAGALTAFITDAFQTAGN